MRVEGFLDAEQILKLMIEGDDAAHAFGDRVSQHGRIFDLSGAKVAPPSAIAKLGELILDPARAPMRANRSAYFGASPLVKAQMKRICALRPTLGLFEDRNGAYSWATGGRPIRA